MVGSLNKVTLIGNLGRDPEIRTTNDGKEIANFSLATSESWKDKKTGQRKDKTDWHKVVCFNEGLVRVIKNYVKKGTKLYLEGQIQTRKWIDNENQEKYVTEVVLQNFNSNLILLSSYADAKPEDTNDSNSQGSNSGLSFEDNSNDLDSDIPF